ncbi:hypothetical protein A5731_03090 [Mycolicibacterium conceptionense]|uniref:ABC transporter domain-containing protein n=1 Tax=Mycolicibacterium conceptionense TaxID=451644 RepID=A0A1A1WQ25_9MYCO|nr:MULTISPECIES: ABC transporter ATP-binding protein [Mycolicibacterium]MCW1823959.1 ABC transporter ATP-binding protein [Mycolicibacterium senegalense]OBB10035.1 hypothetical protein A5718_08870 [Mycolicibacterium conceptionense]OBF09013.1 hypothetical protein A5731_03090 [Mycolicibacterium conceptionense]OBF28785.1 hypothetical protein A5726_02355 [Mycolicibacterium conceptionense]OBF39707.1 hypothetical protein A5720_00370 [Mycolicibacterium conceptionense]
MTTTTHAEERLATGHVSVENISKTYGDGSIRALEPLSIDLPAGQFTSIIGPSGCGKTTFLKIVGDLIKPSGGQVSIDGAPAHTSRVARRIGYALQTPVLLPWKTVADNVMLPYAVGRSSGRAEKSAARERAAELLEVTGLQDFAQSLPAQLSVGMRARVGLAQALVHQPDLLLMDEPFAALDELTRARMALHLMKVWEQTRISVLFVTHHIEEAVLLSNRIIVMSPRPARIRKIVDVDLPRPRTIETRRLPEFRRLTEALLQDFYDHDELGDD